MAFGYHTRALKILGANRLIFSNNLCLVTQILILTSGIGWPIRLRSFWGSKLL